MLIIAYNSLSLQVAACLEPFDVFDTVQTNSGNRITSPDSQQDRDAVSQSKPQSKLPAEDKTSSLLEKVPFLEQSWQTCLLFVASLPPGWLLPSSVASIHLAPI
jgi:hypothetical protein